MDREKVQCDFDELARLSGGDSGSDRYDRLLLKLVPDEAVSVLEIGCGSGRLTQLLAAGAAGAKDGRQVTALDLSAEMIARARQRIGATGSVSFHCGDFLEQNFNSQKFDCVISAATLHHMPEDLALPQMKTLLKPGGTLIIHDVRSDSGLADSAGSYTALAYDMLRRLLRTGRTRQPRAVRQFWDRHGRDETYLTLKEARNMAEQWLPGARVLNHRLWRYTIVWKNSFESTL